jgi:hypothetical protein
MQAFECTGLWWLPNNEERRVAGTLAVSAAGRLRLSLVGPLGGEAEKVTEKKHPIILGSVEKSPLGNEVTLTGCSRTGMSFGSFLDTRERYHPERGYFGAFLPQESAFAFKSMGLRIAGLGEWIHTQSGFERKHPQVSRVGDSVPLGFYKRRAPVTATVPGGSIIMGFGLNADLSAAEYTFREEAQLKITCETPKSADELNEKYVHALRTLMTFVCDREQAIERFSVWLEEAPNREIVVVGERVQPEDDEEAKETVHWREMLFTLEDVDFPDFIVKWLRFMEVYAAACNVFFGLLYGPPAYVDMTFQSVANAVDLYYARREEGVARRAEEERRMKRVLATLPPSDAEWLVDHLGVRPYPPFEIALRALLDRHGDSLDPLITGRRERFANEVLNTLDYVTRREPETEAAASHGPELYWLMQKLRFLLKACFLHELGFSAEKVRSCIGRNPLFHHMYEMETAREGQTKGLPA